MKSDVEKEIEKRTGEILRRYTTFTGHLKNFLQQYHYYDLLLMCKKIYELLQKKEVSKLDWTDCRHAILFNLKTKNYRKDIIENQDKMELPANERVDVAKTYNEIWPEISQLFTRKKTDNEIFYEMMKEAGDFDELLRSARGPLSSKKMQEIFDEVLQGFTFTVNRDGSINCKCFL